MADPVFDVNRCPIATVTPIPGGNLLADDTVPDPPGPIPDCADDPIAPLTPAPPCPTISTGTAAIAYGRQIPAASIVVAITPGDCCDFSFDIGMRVPCPAVSIAGGTSVTHPIRVVTDDTVGYVTLMAVPGKNCAFDLDIDLTIPFRDAPCPIITSSAAAGNPVVFHQDGAAGLGIVTLAVTEGGGCDFNFDINLDLPCPTFTAPASGGTVSFAPAGDPGKFEVLVLPITTAAPVLMLGGASASDSTGADAGEDNCGFSLSFGLQIPCPPIRTGAGAGVVRFVDPAAPSTVSVISVQHEGCETSLSFGFDLACADLRSLAHGKKIHRTATGKGWASRAVGRELDEVSLSFSDSAPQASDAGCLSTLDLSIGMPTGLIGIVNGYGHPQSLSMALPVTANVWDVTVYPDGPNHPETSQDVAVRVLNLPASGATGSFYLPIGKWIGPIFPFDDDSGGTDYFFLLKETGKIAITTSLISARSDLTHPGTGTADLYEFDGTVLNLVATNQTIWTTSSTSTLSGRLIQLKVVDGALFEDVDDC